MYQIFSLCILFATTSALSLQQVLDRPHKAPLLSANADAIAGSYIVAFSDNAEQSGIDSHLSVLENLSLVSKISRFDLGGFRGYAGQFDTNTLEIIRTMPEIAYIEQDQLMHAMDTQRNAPWGLARVSHRERLNSRTREQYIYEKNAGLGVNVYVVDTGINTSHVDFEGRARWGATVPDRSSSSDRHGHGTHCAGIVAGATYGIAKKANVIAVKVLGDDGSGSTSDIIRGLQWVMQDHQQQKKGRGFKGSVVNMSLGGGFSRSFNRAVDAVVDAGITVAVAAGNENGDACDVSPASAEKAITVAASTIDDQRASYSNYGVCVDLFGPGSDIKSAYIGSNRATATMSGTSMASPHVAGLAAYLISMSKTELTPSDIKNLMVRNGTRNALSSVPSSTPNVLIWSNPPSSIVEPTEENLSLKELLRELLIL